MMYVLTLGGLIALLIAGEVLVRGAVGVATRLGVPTLVIGLTVVAFGTSAPELLVGVTAALGGAPGIAVGNVVGSNIANVLMVLGVPALIMPIACGAAGVKRSVAIMLGASLVFLGAISDGTVVRWEGLALVALLVFFLVDSYRQASINPEMAEEMAEESPEAPKSIWVSIGLVLAGCIGLALGADWLVDGAVQIALSFGVSEVVIGLTVVAIGTSFPELATALVAARRGHADVGIGNVVGSNIFNVLAIMGVTAAIIDVPVDPQVLRIDVWVMLAAALIIVPFAWRGGQIGRMTGAVLSLGFVGYLALQVVLAAR